MLEWFSTCSPQDAFPWLAWAYLVIPLLDAHWTPWSKCRGRLAEVCGWANVNDARQR